MPILTFDSAEEHQANPAQHFATKSKSNINLFDLNSFVLNNSLCVCWYSEENARNKKLAQHKVPHPPLGNKLKDSRNCYMPKSHTTQMNKATKQITAITEEKSLEELEQSSTASGWIKRKEDEMEKIQSILGDDHEGGNLMTVI